MYIQSYIHIKTQVKPNIWANNLFSKAKQKKQNRLFSQKAPMLNRVINTYLKSSWVGQVRIQTYINQQGYYILILTFISSYVLFCKVFTLLKLWPTLLSPSWLSSTWFMLLLRLWHIIGLDKHCELVSTTYYFIFFDENLNNIK